MINALQHRISIIEEDNNYLQIEYEAMKVKFVEYEESEVNPKIENIKAELNKKQGGNRKEEAKGELSLANEVEVNNLDNIKGEL